MLAKQTLKMRAIWQVFFSFETKPCLGLSRSNRDLVSSGTAMPVGFGMPGLHNFKIEWHDFTESVNMLSSKKQFGLTNEEIIPYLEHAYVGIITLKTNEVQLKNNYLAVIAL